METRNALTFHIGNDVIFFGGRKSSREAYAEDTGLVLLQVNLLDETIKLPSGDGITGRE